MIFSDKELLDFYKLKNIVRYNTRPHLKSESVAEHSFYVALLSMILVDKYQYSGFKATKSAILSKALLHDMPEIETNDITHDAKEMMNLRKFLETYEFDYYKRKFPEYYNLMKDNNKFINNIINLADSYSVYQYTLNEIQLGNKSEDIKEIYENSLKRIELYEKELEKISKGE